MSAAALDDATLDTQVQGLALTGYGTLHMRTLVLAVTNAARAREFVGRLVESGLLAFGRDERIAKGLDCAIAIGFTYQGLRALGAPAHILAALKDTSPAFAEGAAVRAATSLGDAGESAAERWDAAFQPERAHVWISIHGEQASMIEEAVAALQRLPGASEGLRGWELDPNLPDGKQLRDGNDSNRSRVHFGFRDGITRPSILDERRQIVRPRPDHPFKPQPGELLLGYPNNDGADLWITERTPDDVADFVRNGSFGVLRKIQQYEQRLNDYLQQQADRCQAAGHRFVTPVYLKAKMCGRWPNGALVAPGETTEPADPAEDPPARFDFKADAQGLGCPFGAHIRRANPRSDPLMPPRDRALFRRGIPYGPRFEEAPHDGVDRGLFGLFFCARIEDQFEHLVAQWLEKNPMGPPNRGRAKDPLTGNHDEPDAQFHIPLPDGQRIALADFQPFVRTRGTLYALFPSLQALKVIAGGVNWTQGAVAAPARPAAAGQAAANRAAAAHAPAAAAPKGTPPAAPAAATPGADPDKAPSGSRPIDAPNDRFCDIVMEGGITSGVIYASAVVELARHYRFQSIGGSSIGAFAAALTAAAEYRRRHGSGDGFEQLAKLPDQLAKQEGGRTRLERVFMPQKETRRLFNIFLATLEQGGMWSAAASAVSAALREYRRLVTRITLLLAAIVLAAPLVFAGLCWAGQGGTACLVSLLSWIPALLLTIAVGIVAALAIGIGWDLGHGVVNNGFGLCRGWDPDAKPDSPDLAAFLHYSIQTVAGRDVHGKPLTFRDLWDAPGSAAQVLGFEARGTGARAINLEVYASNLTHSRPYRFPLEETEDMGRLFFRVDDLECYFPKGIVQYLAAVSLPYAPRSQADPPADQVLSGYLQLPVADLPVVVAARLAMSFPLLISAVPLYAVEHGKAPRLSKCWISDGGLCSNFPIHLFDSFLPMWPTFGISLNSRDADNPDPVRLPAFHSSGRADTWDHWPQDGPWRLVRFLGSLWQTTWRWNDSTMMRMPGVRDRVVRLYLAEGEGGLNIRMPPERIRLLGTTYGTPAAKAFIAKFQPDGARGWHEHRWVRLNCLLISLRDRIRNFGVAARLDRHATPLGDQFDAALEAAPLAKPPYRIRYLPSEQALDAPQVEELKRLVRALTALESAFERTGDPETYRAIPRSSLRIRHPT